MQSLEMRLNVIFYQYIERLNLRDKKYYGLQNELRSEVTMLSCDYKIEIKDCQFDMKSMILGAYICPLFLFLSFFFAYHSPSLFFSARPLFKELPKNEKM